jgi:hypothetical protein
MKTPKTIFVVGLTVALGCVVAAIIVKHHAARQTTGRTAGLEQAGNQMQRVAEPASKALSSQEITTPSAIASLPVKTDGQTNARPQNVASQTAQPTQPSEPVSDPLARAALSYVGADPAAEGYWVAAINDPNLSADERQNLIEDLNEDGLSDPRNPGIEDLPLIWNRIQLIEELAPYAMDQVNFDAFEEAYKDLWNMINGRRVQ